MWVACSRNERESLVQLAITELTESVVALFFAFAPIVDINARRMIENNLVIV